MALQELANGEGCAEREISLKIFLAMTDISRLCASMFAFYGDAYRDFYTTNEPADMMESVRSTLVAREVAHF